MHPISFDEFMTVCGFNSMGGNPPSRIREETALPYPGISALKAGQIMDVQVTKR
jgi:hypothetical protein